MIITGMPGAGKSQLLKAFIWHAFQHHREHQLLVCSYTWRAALNVSYPPCPAMSTTKLFGLNPFDPNAPPGKKQTDSKVRYMQDRLDAARFLIIDELSLLGQRHLSSGSTSITANMSIKRESKGLSKCDTNGVFGGLHAVLLGDPMQHEPVKDRALWRDIMSNTSGQYKQAESESKPEPDDGQCGDTENHAAAKEKKRGVKQAAHVLSRDIYGKFREVYQLTTQHRQSAKDEDGKKMLDRSGLFNRICKEAATKEEVESLITELND